ncbi:hypothetical protein AK812_SmicGene46438, partial [Symbiodinium microadriaticum]
RSHLSQQRHGRLRGRRRGKTKQPHLPRKPRHPWRLPWPNRRGRCQQA